MASTDEFLATIEPYRQLEPMKVLLVGVECVLTFIQLAIYDTIQDTLACLEMLDHARHVETPFNERRIHPHMCCPLADITTP